MRILHTIPGRNWGGAEQRTLDQVRWLADHGHAVFLAAPADGEPFRRAVALGLPVTAMAFDRPWGPATLLALRRFVIHHHIEVIDTHVTRDAKAAIGCLDRCAVVRSRHVNQPLIPSPIRRLQWRLGADHVITVAAVTRNTLIADGMISPARSTAIGGWADDRFFQLPADRPGTNTILCVGMLRPDKGQDHLIAALRLLNRRGTSFTCLLAGSATAESAAHEASLRARAEGLDIQFLGYREDIPALMAMADLVVIPSLTEAQPRVAVQAFAAGRPVVASAVGGLPEIVTDGITGWLVPSADPAALADAILRGLGAEAGSIAANARALAESSMRFDARMAQTLAAYDKARANARKRGAPV